MTKARHTGIDAGMTVLAGVSCQTRYFLRIAHSYAIANPTSSRLIDDARLK
ncbi:MAG: hypothetical protein WCP96_17980 [Methylococcaceae bacterium]